MFIRVLKAHKSLANKQQQFDLFLSTQIAPWLSAVITNEISVRVYNAGLTVTGYCSSL
jgi:hypothetical protein